VIGIRRSLILRGGRYEGSYLGLDVCVGLASIAGVVGMILWITGNSGSGKSMLGRVLSVGRVWLDGDDMRGVWPGLGYSREDRWENNMRIARLAKVLNDDQGIDVIVSSICPYRELRDEIRRLVRDVQFVFLAGGMEASEEYPYEGRGVDEGIYHGVR